MKNIQNIINNSSTYNIINYDICKNNASIFLSKFIKIDRKFDIQVANIFNNFKIDKHTKLNLFNESLLSKHFILVLLGLHFILFSDKNENIIVTIKSPNEKYNKYLIKVCSTVLSNIIKNCSFKEQLNLPIKYNALEILFYSANIKTILNDFILPKDEKNTIIEINYTEENPKILETFLQKQKTL